MSFAFPKPVPDSRIRFSDSDSDFDIDEWIQIILQRGPDYDEFIISLSLYAFNRLSPSDQQEQLEELRRRHDFYVNVEDSDFIELFKKLTYSDHLELLPKFLQKFKRERLISSFKQLDAEHQQQLIESMNHLAPEENLPDPQETEADFRLRRFTQLCRDHTRDVLKLTWKSEDEQEEDSSDLESFFLGSSIIWFQGQLASDQDMLIEQLSKRVGGTVAIEPRLQDDETEEDFKLKTFIELCNKIGGVTIIEESTDEEDFRMKRFKELFNQVPVPTRIDLFKELRKILLKEKGYSGAVRFFRAVCFFRGLGSKDQTVMIEKLSDEITKYRRGDPAELKIEKFSGESEEDFRLTRFKEVCIKHLSRWEYIRWPSEADREHVRQGMSDKYQESPYASFLFDASIPCFKAICANYRRNSSSIHDMLFGQVEFRDLVIEKLPKESEEDCRLRKFRVSETPEGKGRFDVKCQGDLKSETPEGKGWFDPEWIKMKLPDLQDKEAAAAAATTQGATSQAGGGRGQGTSTSTVR